MYIQEYASRVYQTQHIQDVKSATGYSFSDWAHNIEQESSINVLYNSVHLSVWVLKMKTHNSVDLLKKYMFIKFKKHVHLTISLYGVNISKRYNNQLQNVGNKIIYLNTFFKFS